MPHGDQHTPCSSCREALGSCSKQQRPVCVMSVRQWQRSYISTGSHGIEQITHRQTKQPLVHKGFLSQLTPFAHNLFNHWVYRLCVISIRQPTAVLLPRSSMGRADRRLFRASCSSLPRLNPLGRGHTDVSEGRMRAAASIPRHVAPEECWQPGLSLESSCKSISGMDI